MVKWKQVATLPGSRSVVNMTSRQRVRLCAVVLLGLVLVAACIRSRTDSVPGRENTGQPSPAQPGTASTSPVTGKPLQSPGNVVAVSIDDSAYARPQSGLSSADLVYEFLTEGGITRYLAIYHSQAPSKVGPVRSTRPYFAVIAREWEAILAHCGGDPKDLEPIRELGIMDADEFKYGKSYWREPAREAPHNLYTSIAAIRSIYQDRSIQPSQRFDFRSWASSPVRELEITYNSGYAVIYRYRDKYYERWIRSGTREELQKDLENQSEIRASNIIVQFAPSKVAYSDGGLVIDLVGSGKAVYVLGGQYSEGTWSKGSVAAPTLFFGSDGKRISIAPGQTWIQVVPPGTSVRVGY